MDGHFSPLSSSTSGNDSAVENLLSEILDLTALEQIQKLPSPLSLPPHLHSRFHRLKSSSFPSPNPNNPLPPPLLPPNNPPDTQIPQTPKSPKTSISPLKPHERSPSAEPEFEVDFDDELSNSSTSGSWSPPRKPGCCLWPSPRKSVGRQSGHIKEGAEDEILSDLSRLSMRRHKETMKKVLKEQENMSKETEQVIKWVKQASSKMRVDNFDDELRSCGKDRSKQ